MLDQHGYFAFADDLIEQPTPEMTPITNSSRNFAQPDFQRYAQRIWKENRNVKTRLSPDRADRCEKGLIREGHNFIHVRNDLPHRRAFRRWGKGERHARETGCSRT